MHSLSFEWLRFNTCLIVVLTEIIFSISAENVWIVALTHVLVEFIYFVLTFKPVLIYSQCILLKLFSKHAV